MKEFVDLGLPSGTLWADENEMGYFMFDEAIERFGNNTPTIDEFQELFDNCTCQWNAQQNGIDLVGKNGNSIFFPANGYRIDTNINRKNRRGYYWSLSKAAYEDCSYYIEFGSRYQKWDYALRCNGFSIRLIKRK